MAGVKYIQAKGVNQTVHAAPPKDFSREDGGKFDFTKELSQQELKYLFEEVGIVNIISKIEVPDHKPKEKPKTSGKTEK